MREYILCVFFCCCGVLFGNYQGDQLTFKDCAMKGEAKLAGGGVIHCGIKENK